MGDFRYVRGHGSEQFGRPDQRARVFYVFMDGELIGNLRQTSPRHTGMWYSMPVPADGTAYHGPFESREEAARDLADNSVHEADTPPTATTAAMGGEMG